MVTEAIIQIFCKIQLFLTLGFVYIWIRLRKPLALKKYANDNMPSSEDASALVAV